MIAIYLFINTQYRKWSLIGFAGTIPEAKIKALTRLKYLKPGTKAEGRRIKTTTNAPEYPDNLSGIGKKVDLGIKPKKKNVKSKTSKRKSN